jgi:hypothetical protein
MRIRLIGGEIGAPNISQHSVGEYDCRIGHVRQPSVKYQKDNLDIS